MDSENQVFNAALRWISHDAVQRRQHVFDVLSNVRLSIVPIHVIDTAINECRDMSLKVALRSIKKDLTSGRGQLVSLKASPRVCAKKSIYIIGGSRKEISSGWNPGDCIFETVARFDVFRRWVFLII